MGVLRTLLTLPIKGPVNGGLWIAGKIHETAEREMNDPAALRKMLLLLEQKLLADEISEQEYDDAEMEILLRIKALQ